MTRHSLFVGSLLATMLLASSSAHAQKPKPIRIVSCDAQVQSKKRGICANHLEPADFPVLAKGVSWWYNWHFEHKEIVPKGVPFEFLPMAWGDRPESVQGLQRYLAAGNRPRQILAINEPNLKGQAYITPEQTATLYKKVKAIGDKYKIPVCGPQMALGSATGDSITAFDPLEKKDVTYTFMIPYLKAFFSYAGNTSVRATSLHAYGNIGEMKWAVETMRKEFNRPVWVTEYAHVPNPKEALIYLVQSTDFLERTPYVEGYAWFKERTDDKNWNIALLDKAPGTLTALGKAYVAMPVHDANLYYRLPGRLPAENYIKLDKAEIWPTDDTDGFTHMASNEAGATLDYNVQVDKAGTYTVRLRVSGEPGKIEILQKDRVLASVNTNSTPGNWQTVTASVTLPRGAQTLCLRFTAKGQSVNWVEFGK